MIKFFAQHPTAANLMMAALMVIFIFTLPNIRRETFPEYASSHVEIRVVYPGGTTEDVGFEFKVFPKVTLQLILWEGDDEFSTEANILFDETIGEILSPEDVAWLSGMLVYRLIALSRGQAAG